MSKSNKDLNMLVEASVKSVAKTTAKSLKHAGYAVPHSVLLHALSAALDLKNWHALKAALKEQEVPASTPSQEAQKTQKDEAQQLRPPRLEDYSGPAVTAEFYTDDRAFKVTFDARPYLQEASDGNLSAIYYVGFSGDYCTDAIAEYFGDKWKHTEEGARIEEAFNYLGARNQYPGIETIGFECRVDGAEFLQWLDAHRPQVVAKLLCEEHGVSIAQSQDEGDAGLWTWTYEGAGCEISLPSREAAELDAYRQCELLQEALRQFG